jgi:hypothetical protein
MAQHSFLESAHFEHRFWLQILGDHGFTLFFIHKGSSIKQTVTEFLRVPDVKPPVTLVYDHRHPVSKEYD